MRVQQESKKGDALAHVRHQLGITIVDDSVASPLVMLCCLWRPNRAPVWVVQPDCSDKDMFSTLRHSEIENASNWHHMSADPYAHNIVLFCIRAREPQEADQIGVWK